MANKVKTSDKFIDKVLITVALFDLAFVVCMIVLFCLFQAVPDTLIVGVLGATFGECGCCAYVFRHKAGVDIDPIMEDTEESTTVEEENNL